MRKLVLCLLLLVSSTIHIAASQTTNAITGSAVECIGGSAAGYDCSNVDLLSFVPESVMANQKVAEVWGWFDSENNREYAIVGHRAGTSFVDVTDPSNPVYVGNLPIPGTASPNSWRDVKTYQDHVYIVGDNASVHGIQIFDLTQLRTVASPPETFTATALDTVTVKSAHNIAINEDTGFAYVVGSQNACGNGLYMTDLSTPTSPSFVGCHNDGGVTARGYVHDVQCVIYNGPDATYSGREICFTSSESHITVVDVEDKNNTVLLSSASYPTASYVHQGWLTEDHRYFIQGDELDELNGIPNTRTIIWDVSDLDDPVIQKEYFASTTDVDHNLYVRGDLVFQANYTSGIRILNISDIDNPVEVGFLDTVDNGTQASVFDGAWGAYPFLPSGNVLVSSGNQGLFVVRPAATILSTDDDELASIQAEINIYPNPATDGTTLSYVSDNPHDARIELFDVLGRSVQVIFDGRIPGGQSTFQIETGDLSAGPYFVRLAQDGSVTTKTFAVVR